MASSHVIGLDIGTSAVRAAEVQFSGSPGRGTPTLVRLGVQPLPPGTVRDGEVVEPAIVSEVIKHLWSQSGFTGKDVVIGIGNQRVVVRELDLPWMPPAQLRSTLPYQVQELLPVAGTDALLDFWGTDEFEGPQGRTVHGMLVAAQRETVVANVLAVEGAGLRATMVDLNAFALLRSLARGELAQKIVGFVDIGARVTNVVVADRGAPRLVRIIPGGGQNVTDAVAAALQISAPEAEQVKRQVGVGFAPTPQTQAASEAVGAATRMLVEAIRNTFVYYAANHPGAGIDIVVLTGGGAHLPGLGQYMSSSSRLPMMLGDAVAGFRIGKAVDKAALVGHESLLPLPVGLACGVAA